jgi:hypothetical protein
MKRALPSYEDLFEEGEIIIEDGAVNEVVVEAAVSNTTGLINESSDEELEMGLKAVLPVGKFDEKFKEGHVPESGEQYLCTVRWQRKKLESIVSIAVERGEGGVKLDDLIKFGFEAIEMDGRWADEYAQCHERSEREFHSQLDKLSEINDVDSGIKDEDEISSCFQLINPSEWYKKLYETEEIIANLRVLRVIKDSQDICEKLLNLHKRWLNGESDNKLNLESNEILNKTATWLQALIMCRDPRLTSPEISNLRQLAVILMPHAHDKIEIREVIVAIVKKYGQVDLVNYK